MPLGNLHLKVYSARTLHPTPLSVRESGTLHLTWKYKTDGEGLVVGAVGKMGLGPDERLNDALIKALPSYSVLLIPPEFTTLGLE